MAFIQTVISPQMKMLSCSWIMYKKKMPPAKWTTMEQYQWLQEQLPEYATLRNKEQKATEIAAEDSRKVQLQTWFRWRTNASKKNCGLKKDTSIFEAALVPKSRSKSAEEIYMDMVYDERIRPLIKAEEEAGNFCKELLEDESDEVKKEVKDKYDKQKKVKRDMLDDEDDNYETDPDAIAKAIDDLPIICQRFARLIKKKTRFIVSFMCAGPEPRHNWDIVSLSCHPSETPAGSNFSQLCPDKDNTFLAAYQQYAELIFPANERNPPLLPGVGDDNEIEELERCNNVEESGSEEELGEDGEKNVNGGCDDSMDWNNSGNTEAGISDASSLDEIDQSAFNSEPQSNASLTQAQHDASLTQAQRDASLAQAPLHASFDWHNTNMLPPSPNPASVPQSSVPGMIEALESSFSHTDLTAMGFLGGGSTMPNPFPPAFNSLAPSFNTAPGYYDVQYSMPYGTDTWNFSNLDSQGEPSTRRAEDTVAAVAVAGSENGQLIQQKTPECEQMPEQQCGESKVRTSPILPAANPPAEDSAKDLASINVGAGLPKSKRKRKSKLPAAEVNCDPAVEPTPTITPTNTAKPKAKPKAKPLPKSSVVTETSYATAEEGPNTATQQNPAVDIGAAPRVSKRVPIKSRRNVVADAIGSDGSTFIAVLKDVGASMTKRPPNLTMEGMIPAKKRRMKA
ncbi:uncharacterized protein F5891DRAFT_988963 [Suillus fuscotomentosus]|uniref:Uncharacterized protein n=1 Tax=Suillus fuscotomentosus TaxID=1912939 RepID=A0AAD4HCF9_9AGAM|nr:uncharacterized protein F5891DRAFT_988963 [Suillus fuscotomentosus]KAG1886405.1 hypothetical protein F5891DRAFT_988963 [Suillus fuscotomentosus]